MSSAYLQGHHLEVKKTCNISTSFIIKLNILMFMSQPNALLLYS